MAGVLLGVGDVGHRPPAVPGRLPRKGCRRVRRSGLGGRHPSGLDDHRPLAPMCSADRLPIMTAGFSALGKLRAPPTPVRPLTPSLTTALAARGSSPGKGRSAHRFSRMAYPFEPDMLSSPGAGSEG